MEIEQMTTAWAIKEERDAYLQSFLDEPSAVTWAAFNFAETWLDLLDFPRNKRTYPEEYSVQHKMAQLEWENVEQLIHKDSHGN